MAIRNLWYSINKIVSLSGDLFVVTSHWKQIIVHYDNCNIKHNLKTFVECKTNENDKSRFFTMFNITLPPIIVDTTLLCGMTQD